MINKINTIIFDLGGVLIDWNPEYVFLDVFKGNRKKMQWFFDNICTSDWNENQDAGYPMAKATEDRVTLFPEYEKEIRMFYGRWVEMLGDAISGTVDILKYFIDSNNYKVVALTNWSAETFPIALERFEFLQWFEGIIVSGEEKTRKPFVEIYNLTLKRFNITAKNAIFIDDNLRNIEAAKKLGINGIQFKSPDQLIKELKTIYNINIQ
jgi:2-haloacid dehalogenase